MRATSGNWSLVRSGRRPRRRFVHAPATWARFCSQGVSARRQAVRTPRSERGHPTQRAWVHDLKRQVARQDRRRDRDVPRVASCTGSRTGRGDAVDYVGRLMPPRRCLKCRLLFTGPRCPRSECSSRQARGYGAEHQAARRALESILPAPCEHGWNVAHPRCNQQAKRR